MKRYNIVWGCGGACVTSMEEEQDGDYVAFEDVESLTAERDRLRKALELCIEAYHEPVDVTDSAANMLHIIEDTLKGP